MPNRRKDLPVYDEIKTIAIKDLKKFLKQGQRNSGQITWSRNGYASGGISFIVDWTETYPFLYLDFMFDGVPVRQKISFASIPSNLRGRIWRFVCPKTKTRCKMLYLNGGAFTHRNFFKGIYHIQSLAHKDRSQQFKKSKSDNAYKAISKKGFRRKYNGRPTRRYLKLLKQIREGKKIDIESLYIR